VLNAVDARADEVGQGVGAEGVRGDPGTLGVGGRDRRDERAPGPFRREIPDTPVDPVADELHPAVPAPGLEGHLGREIRRLDLHRQVGDVPTGGGDVPPGPDDPREVRLVVERAGVDRGPAVPQRQDAHGPLGQCLLAGRGEVLDVAAALGDADVAVRVDQAGQQPAAAADRLRARDGLEGEPAVPHPHVAGLPQGEHHA
jgi:hypothetical protein